MGAALMEGFDSPEFDQVEIDEIDAVIRSVANEARAARIAARQAPRLASAVVEHLGERVRAGKYGHRVTREMYALPATASSIVPGMTMSDEWCQSHRQDALENFDLNMAFFAQIPLTAFEAALGEMLRRHTNLRPISDLRSLEGVGGVYVMVLDDYHQSYIGQAADIRARIRAHWHGTKQFDRLLWGSKHESVLSIDSFRALDTTRIFAAHTTKADLLERKIVRDFPPDYLLNRVAGGKPDWGRVPLLTAEIKRRHY